ncbi:MAG: hypothetical protein ACJAVT_002840 [Yoonia sp.]|jgi:hypothetical protein|tara:strand:+ start:1055 stop:1459 length:405 start_codon:yes stop_codon:yes gene_type:complete
MVEVILPRLTEGFPMNIQQSTPMTPLRAGMIADMSGRSPETAAPDDVKYFQQHLVESGTSICTGNQTMTGVKCLFRLTLRPHHLVAEIFSLREPIKAPLVMLSLACGFGRARAFEAWRYRQRSEDHPDCASKGA